MNRDVAKLEEVTRLEARVEKLENEIAKLMKRVEQLEKERSTAVISTTYVDIVPSDKRSWP